MKATNFTLRWSSLDIPINLINKEDLSKSFNEQKINRWCSGLLFLNTNGKSLSITVDKLNSDFTNAYSYFSDWAKISEILDSMRYSDMIYCGDLDTNKIMERCDI